MPIMTAGGEAVLWVKRHQSAKSDSAALYPPHSCVKTSLPNSTAAGRVVVPATWKIIIAGDDENCQGWAIRKHSWLL